MVNHRSLITLLAAFGAIGSSFAQAHLNLIAKLEPGISPELMAAAHGIQLVDTAPYLRYAYFTAPTIEQQAIAKAAMRNSPGIVWVEDDDEASITESTNGKGGTLPQLRAVRLGVQYSPGSMYAENTRLLQQISWSYEHAGQEINDVRVAILDTGLSPLQPSLWERTVASKTFIPRETRAWDYRSSPAHANLHEGLEVVGHGTMVAGLVAQLAPDCSLVVARICDNMGRTDAWRIAKGLSYAMEQGCEIANLSIGSVSEIPAISEVLDDADQFHMVVVGPLGNRNKNEALYPSAYRDVIAVSGVDPNDVKADFSNYHTTSDLAAPATGIKSAWWQGGMAVWHGTSFAAPIVAGCLAEAMKERPSWNLDDLMDATVAFGDDIDALNPAYLGKLGPRVNMQRMRQSLRNLP